MVNTQLYDSLKEKRVPTPEVIQDSLVSAETKEEPRKECVELFLENAKFLALLCTSAGAEHLATIEHILESVI